MFWVANVSDEVISFSFEMILFSLLTCVNACNTQILMMFNYYIL